MHWTINMNWAIGFFFSLLWLASILLSYQVGRTDGYIDHLLEQLRKRKPLCPSKTTE